MGSVVSSSHISENQSQLTCACGKSREVPLLRSFFFALLVDSLAADLLLCLCSAVRMAGLSLRAACTSSSSSDKLEPRGDANQAESAQKTSQTREMLQNIDSIHV